MLFVMSGETRLVNEPTPTDFADMRLLSSVNSFVYLQVRISHKSFSTFCTTQWLAHPMDICVMSKKTFFDFELDVTMVACSCWIGFRCLSYIPVNRTYMVVEVTFFVETLSTVNAHLRPRSLVNVYVVTNKRIFQMRLEVTFFTFKESHENIFHRNMFITAGVHNTSVCGKV